MKRSALLAPAPTRIAVFACVVLAAGCAAEPLEFAAWTIPVPEGTRVVEYGPVGDEERAEHVIEVERDLVIGAVADGAALFRPAPPKVDAEGRIYVLERGNQRVRVFGPDGTPLVAFGREGQGPGEFGRPLALGIVDGQIVVTDSRNDRLSVFTPDGGLIADNPLEVFEYPGVFVGHPSGGVLGAHSPPMSVDVTNPATVTWTLGRRTFSGETASVYIERPYRLQTMAQPEDQRGGFGWFNLPMRTANPRAALGTDGRAYVSDRSEYQVIAMDADGDAIWALRVAQPARDVTEAEIEQMMELVRSRDETLTRARVNWPQRHPVIDELMLDAAGNLYVFPYRFTGGADDGDQGDGLVPVDVYDPDGRRLVAGVIGIADWSAAHGPHVYRLETDPETEEQVVARYRLGPLR